jgi:hypothetical protein
METHSVKVDKDLFVDKLFGLYPYHLHGTHKIGLLKSGSTRRVSG